MRLIELTYRLIGSFFISLLIHYGFERFYLKWEKRTIGYVLLVLLLINGGALLQIYRQFRPFLQVIKYEFRCIAISYP